MMARSYRKKTDRSRRKVQNLQSDTVTVQMGADQVRFQMVLPMSDLLFDVAEALEHTASHAGLLMMKGLIDDEVKQIVGKRYAHQADRTAMRWGREEGHLIFAGRKVEVQRPRVRSVEGREIPLQRYQAFGHPQRMEKALKRRHSFASPVMAVRSRRKRRPLLPPSAPPAGGAAGSPVHPAAVARWRSARPAHRGGTFFRGLVRLSPMGCRNLLKLANAASIKVCGRIMTQLPVL